MRRFRALRRAGLWLALLLAAGPAASAAEPPALPPLQATTLAGDPVTIAADGRLTVLLLWSPDSLASRKSIGELERFAAAYRDRDVRTLAISTLHDGERLQYYAEAHALTLPLLVLGDHDLGPLPEHRLPLIYLLDRQGRVRAIHSGLFRLRDLEGPVDTLLAE